MRDDDIDVAALEELAEALVDGHQKLMGDLVAMRARQCLTQAQVAERMGVSQPTVAAFERYDSNPKLSTIRRYALAVDARIEEKVVDDCAERHVSVEKLQSVTGHWGPSQRRVGWLVGSGRA